MGWSLIEPGDRTRGQSLVAEARDAVFVMVGVIPAFGMAALIEGFITPSGINHALSITLGVVVAAAYVVVLFVPLRRRTQPAPALRPLEEGSSILKENPGT
ncbi:MAG TPA: stage II sporulation protein M, partial [Actinomycetota bacterium]|nr:stage II sporulation protein M [Actinomycetota bacterium]